MSERPYRVLFSGCRSQRTADQILAHLRAGHDVTVGLRPNGVEIERMEIDGVREVFELTEDDIAACRSFMPRFQLERGGNYRSIPLTEDQKSAILRKLGIILSWRMMHDPSGQFGTHCVTWNVLTTPCSTLTTLF